MNAKTIGIIVGCIVLALLVCASVAAGAYWSGTHNGRNACNNERADEVQTLRQQLEAETTVKQEALDAAAMAAAQLTKANQEASDAIQTVGKRDRELSRVEDMLRSTHHVLDAHLVDFDHVASVYADAVRGCEGLPDSDRAWLVPKQLQQSSTQSVAEAIKRLVYATCEARVNYNGLHQNYITATTKKPAK